MNPESPPCPADQSEWAEAVQDFAPPTRGTFADDAVVRAESRMRPFHGLAGADPDSQLIHVHPDTAGRHHPKMPGTFPWTAGMPHQALHPAVPYAASMTVSSFHAPDGAAGAITAGGSGSIVPALKTIRGRARELKGISTSGIIVPQSSCAVFNRLSHLRDIKVVPPGTEDGSRSFDHFECTTISVQDRLGTNETMLVVAIADGGRPNASVRKGRTEK